MTWRVKLRAQKDAQKQLARTSLSNDDGDAEDDAESKMSFVF